MVHTANRFKATEIFDSFRTGKLLDFQTFGTIKIKTFTSFESFKVLGIWKLLTVRRISLLEYLCETILFHVTSSFIRELSQSSVRWISRSYLISRATELFMQISVSFAPIYLNRNRENVKIRTIVVPLMRYFRRNFSSRYLNYF